MAHVLTKIEPFHGKFVPDPRWEVAGRVPVTGEQLYRETSRRSRGIPLLEPEGEAKLKKLERAIPDEEEREASPQYRQIVREHRVWARHWQTHEPLYPKNKREDYELERLFWAESQGNGNVELVAYRPPTAEEIARAEREGKIAEMDRKIATMFVDRGLNPEDLADLFAAFKSGVQVIPEPELAEPDKEPEVPEPEIDAKEYPHYVQPAGPGVGLWQLSNGTEIKGKKDEALEAQRQIDERREELADAPGY